MPALRRVGRRGRRGVTRRAADHGLGTLGQRLGDRHGHTAVLERTRRVQPFVLEPDLGAEALTEALGQEQGRVALLERDDVLDAIEVEPVLRIP